MVPNAGRSTRRRAVALGVGLAMTGVFAAATVAGVALASSPTAPRVEYRIDSKSSKLVVQTLTGGASFRHDHRIEAGTIAGSMSLVPYVPDTASLEIQVRADQLHLADPDVSPGDRQRIDGWIRRALAAERYKEIVFRSTSARAEPLGDQIFDLTLTGDLRLHGHQNPVTVAAQVFMRADTLKARGTFRVRQSDFGIPLASVGDGTVSVEDEVLVSFEIYATSRR